MSDEPRPSHAFRGKAARLMEWLLLFAVPLLLYVPAMRSGFIWDDNKFLTANPLIHAADGLRRFWFTTQAPDYFPLTSSMLWLEWRLWGTAHPGGYHAVNVLLHAMSSILLWRVLRRLAVPGAWPAALLFAVHPVCVESVAWITERKNTLPMALGLGAVLMYVRSIGDGVRCQVSGVRQDLKEPSQSSSSSNPARRGRGRRTRTSTTSPSALKPETRLPAVLSAIARRATAEASLAKAGHLLARRLVRHSSKSDGGSLSGEGGKPSPSYLLSLLLFLLALLAKTSVVMLPAALLVIGWWRDGRLTRRAVLRMLPFFALSAALALTTVWFQYNRAIAEMVVRTDSLWSRLAGAGWAVWFYLYKLALPLNLEFVYPRWNLDPANPAHWLPLLTLGAVFALLWRARRAWGAAPLAALAVYVLMLLPVLGFFNIFFMAYSLVADHWQYPAMPAMIALAVGAAWRRCERAGESSHEQNLELRNSGRDRITTSVPDFLSSRSSRASGVGCWSFSLLLAAVFSVLSWRQQAIYRDEPTLYRSMIVNRPDNWMAMNNLGSYLYDQGDRDECLRWWRETLRAKPDHAEAHFNIGHVLEERGDFAAALRYTRRAAELQPSSTVIHQAVARLLAQTGGDPDLEAYHLHEALRRNPKDPAALYDLAVNYGMRQDWEMSMDLFSRLLAWYPNRADAHHGLASVLSSQGRADEARPYLEQALRLNPNLVEALTDLGNYWFARGNSAQALSYYDRALARQPGFVLAAYNRAMALDALGRAAEAATAYRRVLDLAPDSEQARAALEKLENAQRNPPAPQESGAK